MGQLFSWMIHDACSCMQRIANGFRPKRETSKSVIYLGKEKGMGVKDKIK